MPVSVPPGPGCNDSTLPRALLNWPARVSGLIAADLGVDPHLVQTVLQQHVSDLLTEAADRFDPPEAVPMGGEAAASPGS